MTEETLEQKLQAMRDEFRAGLAKRWEDIDAAWQAACGADQDAQETLHRLAHSLAGSGATFRLENVSDAARALERAVEAVHEVEDVAASGAITARLAALEATMSDAGERRQSGDEVPSPLQLHRDDDERRLVYIIEDDKQFADNLATQIEHFGYQVETFYELKDVEAAVAAEQPTAIIADIVFPEGRLAGIETVERFHQQYGGKFPVIFMSTRDDIEARLLSVRAGGAAYFTKPLDVTSLIDTLDELTSTEPKDPYRVLVVDDEPTMTMFYTTVLSTAGMEVASLNDPLAVLSEIADFQPEIILLDLYMPGCSGLELARMIR